MCKLSPMDIQFWREKGLCSTCDERYSLSHRCATKHYFLIQSVEELPWEEIVVEENLKIKQPPPVESNSPEQLHLSYDILTRTSDRRSIQFSGSVNEKDVRVLMDGGSSDNFIYLALTKRLLLAVHQAPQFKVQVGSSDLHQCEGNVREVSVQIHDHTLFINVFVLPIATEEIVLGDIWLETLDTYLVNYKKKFISFLDGNRLVTLQGEMNYIPAQARFHQLKRLNHTKEIVLLYTYKAVFQNPQGLPPPRSHDHAIPLVPNAPPVKVKPYRYPHSKKSEIEHIVANMLAKDYRALNVFTVTDSFPMPTVDEILDELFGAHYFSKLDLQYGYHQIRVRPEDCLKTAFRTHQGLHEWLVMPFGLTNALATFQSLMNSIFDETVKKVFTSKFWEQCCGTHGITLARSSAYHPESDGQTEVLNWCLEMYLRCYTQENPKDWFKLLPWAAYSYNSSFHSAIGMTPFKVVFGRDPPPLLKYEPRPLDIPSLQEQLQQRDRVLVMLRRNLERAQQRMKAQADCKRREVDFQIGDFVYVKLHPYRQNLGVLRKNQKLSMKYFGPFSISSRIWKVAYRLALSPTAKIHQIFHISLLKKCEGAPKPTNILTPLLIDEKSCKLQPHMVLGHHMVKNNGKRQEEILIKWQGLSDKEATWELYEEMRSTYPFFNFEDKVVFHVEDNDTIKRGNRVKKRTLLGEGRYGSN
ncbi:uncharacterized protein [Arachis hypogaea]|uniref:uncharacterized protein n=1 Tax=Arachis hypogaea TaxID=3818 RepID=UPI003B222F3F